jgi:hypothetical protein
MDGESDNYPLDEAMISLVQEINEEMMQMQSARNGALSSQAAATTRLMENRGQRQRDHPGEPSIWQPGEV